MSIHTVPEAEESLNHRIGSAHDRLLGMTGDARRRCEEESEAIQDFVTAIADAGSWDNIRAFLRPYLRGAQEWPALPDYRGIESQCDETIGEAIDEIRESADNLAAATREGGLAHTLAGLARQA